VEMAAAMVAVAVVAVVVGAVAEINFTNRLKQSCYLF
jgi:hypothetical protein